VLHLEQRMFAADGDRSPGRIGLALVLFNV
jgi:hypothetical protein